MSCNREQGLQGIIDGVVIRNAELQTKLKAMTEERDIWIFNAKALQKGYNELEAKLREAREEIDRLKAWGVPTKGEGK